MTSPYLLRQKRGLNEFKKVSELDDWFEAYDVEVMPDPTKPSRLRWYLMLFGSIAVVAGIAGFLV